jgi:hypothetical protein
VSCRFSNSGAGPDEPYEPAQDDEQAKVEQAKVEQDAASVTEQEDDE